MKSLRHMLLAGLLASAILCGGCLGPGHMTGHVFQFNKEVEGKWPQEGVFVLLLPVYIVTSFIDSVVLNSIYWWTGDHPVDPPSGPEELGL